MSDENNYSRREFIAMGAALPVAMLHLQPHKLLENATKLAEPGDGVSAKYFWISDHELLILRRIRAHAYYSVSQLDTKNGKEALLNPFSKKYGSQIIATRLPVTYEDEAGVTFAQEMAYISPSMALSPDRKWLAWRTNEDSLMAARLDDTEVFRHPRKTKSEPVRQLLWLSDSKHCIGLVLSYDEATSWYKQAIVYNLSDINQMRYIDLQNIPADRVLGATENNCVLILHTMHGNKLDRSEYTIHSIDLFQASSVSSKTVVNIPLGADIVEVSLSPQGDQIGWLFSGEAQTASKNTYSLWISDVAGGNMREIGSVEAKTVITESSPTGHDLMRPENICWTPDGKYISFLFNGALYRTIAA